MDWQCVKSGVGKETNLPCLVELIECYVAGRNHAAATGLLILLVDWENFAEMLVGPFQCSIHFLEVIQVSEAQK